MIPINPLMPKPLTCAQCLAAGGHCWQEPSVVFTDAVWGGQSRKTQECKHCPARRHGVSREPWEWTYEPPADTEGY